MRAAAALACCSPLALPAAARAQAGYELPRSRRTTRSWTGRARAEIYAYGLRNPYRWSFDRATGDMYVGDVGQGTQRGDRLDQPSRRAGRQLRLALPRGYGGRTGRTPLPGAGRRWDRSSTTPAAGSVVIGGYVVRDPSLTGLVGRYLYADFNSGQVRSLGADLRPRRPRHRLSLRRLGAFGEDGAGHLYVTAQDAGAVYRLWQAPARRRWRASQVAGTSCPHLRDRAARATRRLFVAEQAGRVRERRAAPCSSTSADLVRGRRRGGPALDRGRRPTTPPAAASTSSTPTTAGDIRIDEYPRSADPDRARPEQPARCSPSSTRRGEPQRRPAPVRPRRLPLPLDRRRRHAGRPGGRRPEPRLAAGQDPATWIPTWSPAGGGAAPAGPGHQRAALRTGSASRQRVLRRRGAVAYVRCSESCAVRPRRRGSGSAAALRAGDACPQAPRRRPAACGACGKVQAHPPGAPERARRSRCGGAGTRTRGSASGATRRGRQPTRSPCAVRVAVSR